MSNLASDFFVIIIGAIAFGIGCFGVGYLIGNYNAESETDKDLK